jgi:hypothetical protein
MIFFANKKMVFYNFEANGATHINQGTQFNRNY